MLPPPAPRPGVGARLRERAMRGLGVDGPVPRYMTLGPGACGSAKEGARSTLDASTLRPWLLRSRGQRCAVARHAPP